MIQRFKTRVVMMFVALLMAGCGESAQSTLTKFLTAKVQNNHKLVYALHSSQDQAAKSAQDFIDESSQTGLVAMYQAIASQTRFRILKVEAEGDRAIAEVEFDMPDYSILRGNMMAAPIEPFQVTKGYTQIGYERGFANKLAEKFKGRKVVPRVKGTESIQLVKESGRWKVYENWERKKEFQPLLEQAIAFEEKKDLKGAKSSYESLLNLASDETTVQKKVKRLATKIEIQEARNLYRSELEVSGNFDVNFEHTWFSGTLKNKGKRSLSEVEFTISYFDDQGKVIFKQTEFPVIMNEPDDQNNWFRPGDIKTFSYSPIMKYLKWNGNAKIEVTNLKFSDEPKLVESIF